MTTINEIIFNEIKDEDNPKFLKLFEEILQYLSARLGEQTVSVNLTNKIIEEHTKNAISIINDYIPKKDLTKKDQKYLYKWTQEYVLYLCLETIAYIKASSGQPNFEFFSQESKVLKMDLRYCLQHYKFEK